MTVPISRIPLGARVRIRRGTVPGDPALFGRMGTVVEASEYTQARYAVALDGESQLRVFALGELEVVEHEPLPPERQAARQRPALP